jgi:hypothetical protein
MALGYTKPLYLLACEHRGSFERDLFEAVQEATERGILHDAAGTLVDQPDGATVARKARSFDHVLAMPVAKWAKLTSTSEYGREFACHIDGFDPTFAKVLVRYHPTGDQALS